jgi:hypothetical protein
MRSVAIVVGLLLAACSEHGSGGGEGCHGLSLGDCRNAGGCVPDICAGCFCDLGFRGCLGAAEVAEPCPELGCPGALCCSTQEQCTNGTSCVPPGTQLGCGACNSMPGDCTSDAECKARDPRLICQPIQCACEDQKMCVDGCVSDDECGDAEQCDFATSRCVARQCGGDPDCPAAFRCDAGRCARATCTTDTDCDGFCVLGQCFAGARGTCEPPVAVAGPAHRTRQ